jgi:hypothetical protein
MKNISLRIIWVTVSNLDPQANLLVLWNHISRRLRNSHETTSVLRKTVLTALLWTKPSACSYVNPHLRTQIVTSLSHTSVSTEHWWMNDDWQWKTEGLLRRICSTATLLTTNSPMDGQPCPSVPFHIPRLEGPWSPRVGVRVSEQCCQ